MTQQVDAIVSDEIVGDTYVVRKKVDELSLDEIKNELEKRNLDFSGDDYAILHERLTDSMIEEGLEPATFEFELEAEDEDEEEEDEPVVKEQQEEKQIESKQEAVKTTTPMTTTTTTSSSSKESVVTSSSTKKDEKKTSAQTQQAPQYKEVPGNHIWVSGLSSRCKAADLKKFFTRYANVGSAKIVANARTNSAHCYGYITVESQSDLQKCVEKLHCTRFEGNFIEVEVCKLAPADQLRKVEMKNRERLAQQKEEFRKRKAERRQKIEEELQKREEALKLEQSRRKESDKRRSEERRGERDNKVRDSKKDPKKDERRSISDRRRSRTRSRSPISRRRPEPPRRPIAGPPPRRFGRSSPPPRRRSPYSRGRPRSRSPSPFGHAAPAPFLHGSSSLIERAPIRMLDRRLEEERIEVERRQRAEAEALEREKRQLRLERERLEREKLDLIRLERERVKKEMEEVAARKELAERRRQEELHRQQQQQQQQEEEQRKREEARIELERRPRESVRQSSQLVSHVDPQIELYDPRVPLAEEYSRSQVDAKFSGRLGPALQREPVQMRHDDRRREDRRRESPIASNPRIERRIPSYIDQWGGQEIKSRGDYIEPSRSDSLSSKRQRSRSPQRSNGAFSQIPSSDFRAQTSINTSESWRGNQAPAPSAASYMDNRRAPAVPRPLDQPQSGSHWTSPARVAFPPAYAQQEPTRGFLTGSSSSSGFGMSSSSGYRRY